MQELIIHNNRLVTPSKLKKIIHNGQFTKDCPDIVLADFRPTELKLTTLKNGPKEVYGFFDCSSNELTNLKHCPEIAYSNFDCSYNLLTDLTNGPEMIKGYYACENNQITTLEGICQKVEGTIHLDNNKLTTLFGISKSLQDYVYVEGNANDLEIEAEFVEQGYTNYYPDLLKHCIENNYDLEKIKTWPEGFLSKEIKQSSKGISKFDL